MPIVLTFSYVNIIKKRTISKRFASESNYRINTTRIDILLPNAESDEKQH